MCCESQLSPHFPATYITGGLADQLPLHTDFSFYHFSSDKMRMKLNEVGWDVALSSLDLQSNEALRKMVMYKYTSHMTSLFLYFWSVQNILINERSPESKLTFSRTKYNHPEAHVYFLSKDGLDWVRGLD